MARPTWKLEVDGQDVTDRIRERLVSIRVTDGRGRRSDRVTVTLVDGPTPVDWPPAGRKLGVFLGWDGQVRPVGEFVVTRPRSSGDQGGPKLEITGHAVSAGGSASPSSGGSTSPDVYRVGEGVAQTWTNTTLGAFAREVGRAIGRSVSVASGVSSAPISHLEMSSRQGYLFVLGRLAQELGADMRVTSTRLVVAEHAGSSSAGTGQPMPTIVIEPGTLERWSGAVEQRNEIQSVRARYRTAAGGQGTKTAGSGEPRETLRRTYPTADEAQTAARARLRRKQGAARKLDLTIAGDARLAYGVKIDTSRALRDDLGGLWKVLTVSHSLGPKGFTTTVNARAIS